MSRVEEIDGCLSVADALVCAAMQVLDLEQSIRKLQLEMARQTADLQRLEKSKAQLDSDMRDKEEALAIDSECFSYIDGLTKAMSGTQ